MPRPRITPKPESTVPGRYFNSLGIPKIRPTIKELCYTLCGQNGDAPFDYLMTAAISAFFHDDAGEKDASKEIIKIALGADSTAKKENIPVPPQEAGAAQDGDF